MKRYNQKEIDQLVGILKNDGVISVPTDTVYGICARIDSKIAYDKLMKVKKRPSSKIFPIMCANEEQIKSIAIVDKRAEKLIHTFMPGPITLILNKRPEVPLFVNNENKTIAIRMATSKFLEDLILKTGSPLFMSSANQSGMPVCTTLEEIEKACPNLDGMMEGNVKFGQSSTIVDCTLEKVEVIREGPISLQQIENVLNAEI